MKKVISALTTVAMCASMSASVMTAFAVDASTAEFHLKAVSASAGTISDDGSTITFATAADAAGAKLTIQTFLKCDTNEPYVQQVGTAYTTSSKSVKLTGGVDYAKKYKDAAEDYVVCGETINTNKFVNCFTGVNALGKYDKNYDQFLWSHSNDFVFDYTGNDLLNLMWQNAKGAAFAADTSDAYPFTEFYAELGSDITDGTYTIEIPDTWENKVKSKPTTNGAFIDLGDGEVKVSKTTPITIKVGDASATTPTDPQPTTEKVEPVTEKQEPTTEKQQVVSDDWTWYAEDVTYDPSKDTKKTGAAINIYVDKDPGTYGYQFTPKIDGKSLKDAGFKIVLADQTEDAYEFGTFTFNPDGGEIGGANAVKENAQVPDGTSIVVMYLLPPADAQPGTKYSVDIADLIVGDYADGKFTPATRSGSITIAGDEQPTTEKQEPTTEKVQPTTEKVEPTTEGQTPSEKPLYGDVNVDGKVELVDVVKLNRYICGIDKEISGVAVINANCYRANNESDADTKASDLDGTDSVEILKYLIKLVTTLPTNAK